MSVTNTEMVLANIERVEIVTGEEVPRTIKFETGSEAKISPKVLEGTEEYLRGGIGNGVLGCLRTSDIVAGYEISLKDNKFRPEIMEIVNGGEVKYDAIDTDKIVGYDSPLAGIAVDKVPFTLNVYTSERDTAGDVVQYVKFTFVKCEGKPVGFEFKHNDFFAPEFEVISRPTNAEKAVTFTFMDTLPA